MRRQLEAFIIFGALLCLPEMVMAQASMQGGQSTFNLSNGNFTGITTSKVVGGRVYTPSGDPIPHARLQITNNAGSAVQDVQSDYRGEFRADYNIFSENVEQNHFTVILKITKKGYEQEHRFAEMGQSVHSLGLAITLRPLQHEDVSLLSQEDLTKGLTARLRQLGPVDGLSPKSAKDYDRALQAFDHGQFDRTVLELVKVTKANPACVRCRSMLGLAEMNWGDWDDARNDFGKAVNALIANRKLGSAEPLVALGVFLSWNHELDKASSYLAGALQYSPNDVMALQELGRVECLSMDWYAGNDSLRKALAAGAGPEARLLHAQALLFAGTPKDAEAEMNRYLDGRPLRNASPRVRSVWASIQARKRDDVVIGVAQAKAAAKGEEPLDYLSRPPRNLADFEPTVDQAQLDAILNAVGKNVSDLFATLPNICSIEKVHQEKLNRKGKADWAQEYKYRYLVLTPNDAWGPSVDEYRADSQGKQTFQLGLGENVMLTAGFVSAPLIFHPAYRRGSTFRLLGRQIANGRSAFLVAYAQDPGKSRLFGNFQRGSESTLTYSQGIAWIDTETYQIVRLATDLLNPMPQVRLHKESTEINFNEVRFKTPAQKFWLPAAVTVTLDWNGKLLRNQHAYSDFLVSNVDALQKIAQPKGAANAAAEADEAPPHNDSSKLRTASFDSATNK